MLLSSFLYHVLLSSVSLLLFVLFFFFKQKTAYEIRLRLAGSELCIRFRTGDALGGTNTLDVNWTFGDGATGNTSISFHTYDTAGDYTITVTASDQDGNTTARSMPISVRSDSLIVNAASNFPSGQATTTDIIQFGLTAESCDINYPTRLDDEAKMVFLWQMGDPAGTVFDGPAPAFTYTAAGTYDVSLTVTYPQLAISRHATMQMVITP